MDDKQILLSDLSDKAKVLWFYLKDYFTAENCSKNTNFTAENCSKLSDLLQKIAVDLNCWERTIRYAYQNLLQKIAVATAENCSKSWATAENCSGIIGLDKVQSRFTAKNCSKNDKKNSPLYIYTNTNISITNIQYDILIKEYTEEYIKEIIKKIEKHEIETNKQYKDYYRTIRNYIKKDKESQDHTLAVVNNPDLQKVYDAISKYSNWVVDGSLADCLPLLDTITTVFSSPEFSSHGDIFFLFARFLDQCIAKWLTKFYSISNPKKLNQNFATMLVKLKSSNSNTTQNIRPAYDLRSKKP